LPLLFFFVLLPLAACQTSPVTEHTDDDASRSLLSDGYRVPIFATAEEQLTYARSSFDETPEKSAALKALGTIHPQDRHHAALAALELAFLELGDDYRLANANQCSLAKKHYLALLEHYSDLPAIAAKALWYLGWISSDLEHDTQLGMAYHRRLIATYPDEILSFLSPAPWLTIGPAVPDATPPSAYPKSALTWAGIAHLEIIRNSTDRDQAWQSFTAIQQMAAGDLFVAQALKVLVERHGFEPRSEQLARAYLDNSGADAALKNDLHLALSSYRRTMEDAGESR
jgi:hypothetical protein